MLTYQDFEATKDKVSFVSRLISEHMTSKDYMTAVDADLYDAQRNRTINDFVKVIYDMSGAALENFVAANNKIASNFFHRLNTQRVTYSLGNGVSFTDHKKIVTNENGEEETIDETKERLGNKFDTDLKKVVYKGVIHGVSFGYWNSDRLYCFPVTEFAPLYDEYTGALRAGVRFWRLAPDKPRIAVLYEENGYTRMEAKDGASFEIKEGKKSYITLTVSTNADGEMVVGEDNYASIPIIPFYGSSLKQSTLIGMRNAIDSFDLVRSGFANDLSDCSEIFWILENYGGMDDNALAEFRDKLRLMHIAEMDTTSGGKLTPFRQEIPFSARQTYLTEIRNGIYEDFGALDVHAVAAGATNDHIDAAYQPMDENADDLEYQIIEFIQQILALEDIEDMPIFKRNRISNQKEQTEMVLSAADYLDEETILQKLPFITVDEVSKILARKDAADKERMTSEPTEDEDNPFEQSEEEEEKEEEVQ